MPKQDHRARRDNFDEVALGYTREMAQEEALRCLQCKKAFCVAGCPVEIDIPAFVKLIAAGRLPGRREEDQGEEQPSRYLRPSLPAGGAVRGNVRPLEEG